MWRRFIVRNFVFVILLFFRFTLVEMQSIYNNGIQNVFILQGGGPLFAFPVIEYWSLSYSVLEPAIITFQSLFLNSTINDLTNRDLDFIVGVAPSWDKLQVHVTTNETQQILFSHRHPQMKKTFILSYFWDRFSLIC